MLEGTGIKYGHVKLQSFSKNFFPSLIQLCEVVNSFNETYFFHHGRSRKATQYFFETTDEYYTTRIRKSTSEILTGPLILLNKLWRLLARYYSVLQNVFYPVSIVTFRQKKSLGFVVFLGPYWKKCGTYIAQRFLICKYSFKMEMTDLIDMPIISAISRTGH